MKNKQVKSMLAASFLALWCFAMPAAAIGLAEAKAAGQVGEQMDGYLGVVNSGASGDVRALVNSVNAQRRAEYERIAAKNGVPVSEVAKMTAQKVIGQAASGHFVQTPAGWQRR
ncbi:MAG: YdbL family protein [Gammaproteobacteria bacterium]